MASLPPPAPRRGRWAALALVSLLVVPPVLCEIAGWPFLARPMAQLLSRQLERPVRIDPPFSLHLYGRLRLQAEGLWIAAPTGFADPHFVAARGIDLTVHYRDLLAFKAGQPLRIAALAVDELDAHLVRHPDGSATWQLGGEPGGPLPQVDRLRVRGGRLVLDDPLVEAKLAGSFDTDEGMADTAPVSRAHLQGSFRRLPFTAQLAAGGWLPLAAGAAAPPLAARARINYGGIHASFDGRVTDLFGRQTVEGSVTVAGKSLGLLGRLIGAPLPTTAPFSLAGTLKRDGALWQADVANARIGQSRLTGRFVFDAGSAPPRLTGDLGGQRLFLADLAPAFGTRREDGTPLPPPPGRTIPDRPLDLPSLHQLEARVGIDIAHVDLGSAFRQPIAPLKGTLTVAEGRLALDGLDARTARGRLSGNLAVDAATPLPRWRADLAWDGIRLEEWLAEARNRAARPDQAPPPPYFTGTFHGRARMGASGRSLPAVLASLDGNARASVRDGSVSHLLVEVLGLDVAQGLGLYLGGDNALPVTCAALDVAVAKGKATPRVALVDTPVTLALATGTIDLGQERLDLRITARPRNFSPLTLRSPIRVGGTFLHPQAAPEGGPIAARVAGGLALATANPLAALLPFLDPGSRDAPAACPGTISRLRETKGG